MSLMEKKTVILISAIICTIVWLGLFPFFLIMATFMTDDPYTTGITGFTSPLIPLSIPITIVSIWLSYFYKKIPFVYWSNLIPIITSILVVIIDYILIG